MNNTMEYKGYIGSVEFSETDQILFGKVQGIRSLISYEGTTVAELIDDFHGAVDDYLELCSAEGKTPEKAFKGSFNVRFKKNRQGFSVIQLPRGIAPFLPIDTNKCLQTCVWCDIIDV